MFLRLNGNGNGMMISYGNFFENTLLDRLHFDLSSFLVAVIFTLKMFFWNSFLSLLLLSCGQSSWTVIINTEKS